MARRIIKKLPTIGRASSSEAFDPDAIDGDNDGIVQELTRFERPGVPGVPKPSRLTGAMSRPAKTTERNKRIVQRYKDGESRKNIAEAEGTTVQGVSWALNQARKRGEITEEPRWKANPERIKRIVEAHLAGKEPQEIADIEGITRNNVSSVLSMAANRGEIEPRRAMKPRKNPAPQLNTTEINKSDSEVLQAYDSGKSVIEIAKERNSRPGEILETLVKYRLPDEDGRMTIARPSKKITNARASEAIARREDRLSGSMAYGNKKQRTQRNQKIVDAYNSGKQPAEIAEEQNLPLRTVRFVLTEERKKGNASSRARDYTPAQALNPKIQERNQKIVDSYNSGKTRQEIADNEKIPLRTVNYVIGEARKPFVEKEKLPRAPKYTERNQKIIDAYNSGKQPGEIAKEQNLPTRTVRYVLGEARKNDTITLRPSVPQPFSSRLNPEIVARNKRITDAYKSGKKYQEIADSEKISLGYVTKIIFEYNKMLRDGRPSENRQGRQANPEIKKRNKKIVDAYNSGLTYQKIADNENLTLRTVTYVIAEARKNKLSGGIRARSASPSVVPPQTSSARANRRSKLPRVDTATPTPGETIKTPGMITGAMANENPATGKKIKTSIDVVKKDDTNLTVSVKYGDLDFTFDINPDAYTEWVDAYGEWSGWVGNYGMRLASAALMGEPLPSSAGYMGDDEGTHVHDLLGSGTTPNMSRSEINDARRTIRDAFVGLNYINSGKEVNTRPIYRGLSNVTPEEQVMNLSAGEIITLPMSAFTSDLQTAKMYATGVDGDTNPGVILEIVPGARTGDAAGDEYVHQFNIGGEWITDVTEQVTQGRFKYLSTTTDYIERNGQRTKVKKITLEQVETFNPVTGKFEKNLGRSSKISGSIGTEIQQDHLRRLGDIREITKGLVAQDMQTLRERAIESYVQRNPQYIKRLALINNNDDWKKDLGAVNPDGTPMSKAEYVAMVNAEQRMEAEIYVSKRLNNYAPDFNPWHLQQMQYNVEMMYLASPQMYVLAETYGFPQYAILTAQEIIGKDGKPNFFPNSEVRAQKMPGEASGISLMHSGISAILPVDGSEFIPKDTKVNDALQNQALLLNGHWGVSPEFFINAFPDNPLNVITRYTEAVAARRMSKSPRPAVIDEGSPITVLRHEASHIMHNNALAKVNLDIQADPNSQTAKEAQVILSLLMKNSWQNAAAVDLQFVNMMLKDSVSDYAASSPPEWLAETLTAALSPSRVTRNLLSFNHRAILATAFPELSDYLTGSEWP